MSDGADILELEKQLTEKERRFVIELELGGDGNGTQAAIRAGYAPGRDNRQAATAASRLLRNDKVLAYRHARAKQKYEALGISPEFVAAELITVYRRCMQAEPVMGTDPESCSPVALGTFTFDSRGALKALELIGKSVGAFTEKVDLGEKTRAALTPTLSLSEKLAAIAAAQTALLSSEGGKDPDDGD